MPRVLAGIDGKSFIIGVLSALVLAIGLGAKFRASGVRYEVFGKLRSQLNEKEIRHEAWGVSEPFAVTWSVEKNDHIVWYRNPFPFQ